ncbi:unnamed protein product [Protopolystoma xenopodis]|uniref:Uncharacterized protein n=1 Tax=Protopolystoma xenopodis TaxID=117903 RepID=A0A448XP02_9PLAT|nr:unnamed protein product [Protopolystoma xenopodis]
MRSSFGPVLGSDLTSFAQPDRFVGVCTCRLPGGGSDRECRCVLSLIVRLSFTPRRQDPLLPKSEAFLPALPSLLPDQLPSHCTHTHTHTHTHKRGKGNSLFGSFINLSTAKRKGMAQLEGVDWWS